MENHQNSYRFVTKFTEVFSCVFLHGYYEGEICTDLSFQPSSRTKFLIKNYNYNPGDYQGYSYTNKSERFTTKLDWNINDKNTFTLKYNYLRSSSQIPPSTKI